MCGYNFIRSDNVIHMEMYMVVSLNIIIVYIWRVPDQNDISRLYNILEIYHSDREPSIL